MSSYLEKTKLEYEAITRRIKFALYCSIIERVAYEKEKWPVFVTEEEIHNISNGKIGFVSLERFVEILLLFET